MLLIPFSAKTISSPVQLPVYTSRSFDAPYAMINGSPVYLASDTEYRFRDIQEGWAHLESEIGFIPMSYLDPRSIQIDPNAYKRIVSMVTSRSGAKVHVNDPICTTVQRCHDVEHIYRRIVDNRYHVYPVDTLRFIIDTYYAIGTQAGIDWVMMIAQSIHETDWFRSWWAQPTRHNFAGIGVTGEVLSHRPPDVRRWAYRADDQRWYRGYTFSSVYDGIANHAALLLVYAQPSALWTETQHALVRKSMFALTFQSHPFAGIASRWVDLNGRWAVPGTSYAQQIARVAMLLLP